MITDGACKTEPERIEFSEQMFQSLLTSIAQIWPRLLTAMKDWAGPVNDSVTAAAIVAGGIWAVWHFRLRRQQWPKGVIAHSCQQYTLPQGTRFLRVSMTITNVGEVLLKLGTGLIRVQQVAAWPENLLECEAVGCDPVCEGELEYRWPVLVEKQFKQDGFELEPSETEECSFDFFLKPEVRAVIIYTHLSNLRKPRRGWGLSAPREDVGWQKTTVYNLQSEGAKEDNRSEQQGGKETRTSKAEAARAS